MPSPEQRDPLVQELFFRDDPASMATIQAFHEQVREKHVEVQRCQAAAMIQVRHRLYEWAQTPTVTLSPKLTGNASEDILALARAEADANKERQCKAAIRYRYEHGLPVM